MLNQAMAVIKEKIEEKRGVFNVQMEVCVFDVADINHEVVSGISVAYFIPLYI